MYNRYIYKILYIIQLDIYFLFYSFYYNLKNMKNLFFYYHNIVYFFHLLDNKLKMLKELKINFHFLNSVNSIHQFKLII